MEPEQLQQLKRRVILGVIGFIVLLFVIWLVRFLQTGTLVVITGDKNSSVVVAKDTTIVAILAPGEKTRLHSGNYSVTVSTKSSTNKQFVDVKARKNNEYSIKPVFFAEPEPVSGFEGHSLVANASALRFIEPTGNNIVSADSGGGLFFNHQPNLLTIKWADVQYGIGQDNNGVLYTINNDDATPLARPSGVSAKNASAYAVSNDRGVYVAYGTEVYFGAGGTDFQKIYSASRGKQVQLFAGNQNATIVETDASENSSGESLVTNIGKNGVVLGTLKTSVSHALGAGIMALWSQDGNSLLLANSDGKSAIYTKSLALVQTLPEDTVKSAAWLPDNTLAYGVDNKLWIYSPSAKNAWAAATFTNGATVSELTLSQDDDTVYIAATGSVGKGIYRLRLTGRSNSQETAKLGIFLPTDFEDCSVSYVNLSKPTIVLLPFAATSIDSCRDEAVSSLQDAKLDLGQFQFVVGPYQGVDAD